MGPLLLLFFIILAGRTKVLLLLLCGIAGAVYILAFKYPGVTRHNGILFIIICACCCIAGFYEKDIFLPKSNDLLPLASGLLAAIVLAQLPYTAEQYRRDITGLYSGARDAAEYITDHGLENNIIVGHQAISATAVLPYLPGAKQFYYSECQRYGSFYRFDSCFTKGFGEYAVDYGVKVAHDNFQGRLDKIIFLFNYPVQPFTARFLDLLYTTPEQPIRGEDNYYIYRFKPGLK